MVVSEVCRRESGAGTCACCGRRGQWRTRWAALGAGLAVVVGSGGIALSGATNAEVTPSQTVISPCRIMDTRSGASNVGPRSTPMGTGETYSIQVTGTNGDCSIPDGTSGVAMNVTIVGPGAAGFLTVFPGPTRPTASNLNYVAGQAPTPNLVQVALNASGQVSFFASGGPVHVIADVAGYTTAARLTSAQLAQNRWDRDLGKPASVGVGLLPTGVAFDGTYVWVANVGSDSVTRINPNTNSSVGSAIAVGDQPSGMAFDGTSMWVTNSGTDSVSRINATTGLVTGTFPVGDYPQGVVYDGTNIWIANRNSSTIVRVNPVSGVVTGTVAVGSAPRGVAFDGGTLWVANAGASSVSRVNPATATVIGSAIPVDDAPEFLAFDGELIWVTNSSVGTVTRIRATSAAVVGAPISVGSVDASPTGIAFDGSSIWVANSNDGTLTRVNATTGTVTGTIPAGTPSQVVFDGTSIWVTDTNSSRVRKFRTG